MGNLMISLFLVANILTRATAFLAPKVQSSAASLENTQSNHFKRTNAAFSIVSSSTSLPLSFSSDRNSNGSDDFLKARTDVRNFLTQRSIQSFVFLLNQCREEHTVRWLEKTLDFTSIDNFHGTGAFNQTNFPEWDSIFLDCVDRPEEVVVIQMRQRRRQRKLSGHNAYFESLKPSASTTRGKGEKVKNTRSINRGFSTANNYLDTMKPSALPSSMTKKSLLSKKRNSNISGSCDYLNNLSHSPIQVSSQTKPSTRKKQNDSGKKMNDTGLFLKDNVDNKDSNLVHEKEKFKEKDDGSSSAEPMKNLTERKTFASGKSTGYLESLSTLSNASFHSKGRKDVAGEKAKTKQSTDVSKNPFLDEKIQEYEFTIDPPALVRRILSVREQLSKEWVEDLEMLVRVNDKITEAIEEYNEKVTCKGDNDDEEDDLNIENIEIKHKEDDQNPIDSLYKMNVAPVNKESDPGISSMLSNISSESHAEKVIPKEEKHEFLFDRSILNLWSQSLWSPKRSSSPYRKANFDLLLLLATQDSIHRVLNLYKKDNTIRLETHEWLLDFYTDNVSEYFDGHQTFARGEDFLEVMLKSPRTLIETKNELLAWVDPAIMAEDIVRERSEVFLEWMKVAETITDEHTDLRRLLFTNMVSKTFPDDSLSHTILSAVKNEVQEDSTISPVKVFGAFE